MFFSPSEQTLELLEVGGREVGLREEAEILLELANAAGADEDGSDARIAQIPLEGELGERESAGLREGVEPQELRAPLGRDVGGLEEDVLRRAAVERYAREVARRPTSSSASRSPSPSMPRVNML